MPVVALEPGLEPFPGCRLRGRLGSGGFADVWEAETTDGIVALKFLPCTGGQATPRELRSIQAVRQLQHPNLVRIHDVWCQPGYVVVAMEKALGSLTDLLEVSLSEYGSGLQPDHACFLLSQAAAALDFLNNQTHSISGLRVSIQHADVKPGNLLMFGDTVKLSDFGVAILMGASQVQTPPAGTTAYSAPELFQGRISHRSDQYSLAVTWCQLRTGRFPFPDSPARFERSYVRPMPDLSGLPERERPIVARALAPTAAARWPSCEAFIDQLAR